MEKSSDARKKPPSKPSARWVVKIVKEPQNERPTISPPPSIRSVPVEPETDTVGVVQTIKNTQVVGPSPSIGSIWVVSAEKPPESPEAVTKSKPIKHSQRVSEGSIRKPPESPEPPQNVSFAVNVGSPVTKSWTNNAVASSSSSVRSVWVESIKKLPELREPVLTESQEEVGDELLAASSLPSRRSVWSESEEASFGSPKTVWRKKSKVPVLREPVLTESQEEVGDELLAASSLPSRRSVWSESEEASFGSPKTVWRKKSKVPVYPIPEHLNHQLDMDVVPEVCAKPLTLSTYADYFTALLYAEDVYLKKWSNFLLYNVNIELDEKLMKKQKNKNVIDSSQEDEKVYVLFEITPIPERRPYLLSRDFVFVRRSGKKSKHFEGKLVRVVKSTHVLTEFGDDFRARYSPLHKYDVSFSFNRTCLKRCHQAVEAALLHPFQHVLFPIHPPRTTLIPLDILSPSNEGFGHDQISAMHKILSLRGPPSYLIKGPLSLTAQKSLSRVGVTIVEVILHIYRSNSNCRILVCAPKNRTCDVLISSLNKVIPDSELFRANAAFREIDDVMEDVLPLCSYDGECFSDLSLPDLSTFRVIASTFMTSFRLHSSGLPAGHFTHIFLVDASSATEPETMVALANLVGDETAVVLTGSLRNSPNRVRSDIARKNGLKRSFFQRLFESESYSSNDPEWVSIVGKA